MKAIKDALAEKALDTVEIEDDEPPPHGPDLRPNAEHVWYWEEDAFRLKRHRYDKLEGTNFVAFAPKVSEYLESKFSNGDFTGDDVNFTYKAFQAETVRSYRVDFGDMRQINRDTRYERRILRRTNPSYRTPQGD